MQEHLPARLQASLTAMMPEALTWLKRMVDINSFTANADGVNRLGELTAELFTPLGFEADFVVADNPQHGRHLFLHRHHDDEKPVLLVTHLDTVFPSEEEERNDFHWHEVPAEERIHGPGTVDIKGGTILIWLMLRALREIDPQLFAKTNWIIAANACEEVMSADFARFTTERCPRGAEAVLVFEGGPRSHLDYHIVTSRKGRAEYRISAHGRAAHAGSAHMDGINAIVALSVAVQHAAAVTDRARELTVNVGKMHGGTVVNRVPHEAVAELEMRAFDPAVLREGGDAIMRLAHSGDGRRAQVSVDCLGKTPAWPHNAANEILFQHWASAATKLGLCAVSVPRGGLSDANYLCGLGPTLDGLGPAGANAHCSEWNADGSKVPEYVETDSFVPKAAMNVLAIRSLLGADENVA